MVSSGRMALWVEKTWDHRCSVGEMIMRQHDGVVGDQLIGGRAEGGSPGMAWLLVAHGLRPVVRCSGRPSRLLRGSSQARALRTRKEMRREADNAVIDLVMWGERRES